MVERNRHLRNPDGYPSDLSPTDQTSDLMRYASSEEARLGDKVRIGADERGVIVCSVDTDELSDEFPRSEWRSLGEGNEAYRLYLPAFIRAAALHFGEADLIPDHVLWSLAEPACSTLDNQPSRTPEIPGKPRSVSNMGGYSSTQFGSPGLSSGDRSGEGGFGASLFTGCGKFEVYNPSQECCDVNQDVPSIGPRTPPQVTPSIGPR